MSTDRGYFDRSNKLWFELWNERDRVRLHFRCFKVMKRLRGLLPLGPQVTEWERELNALVYELYGLTEDEIRLIERY